MNRHAALLAAACALALAACGGDAPPPAPEAPPVPAAAPAGSTPAPSDPAAPAPDATAPADAAAAPVAADEAGSPAAGDTAPAAAPGGCSVDIEGNDQMQYSVSAIDIPASCSEFTIHLAHVGRLPEAAMGHNVVVTASSDMAGVAADGIAAGAAAGFLKAGDPRVVAATEMVGGGERTSVTFPVDRLRDGGPWSFFCSFPGHAALMKGTIRVV